jgi:DNA-binding LacI/PurR family transcriptional regulator
VSTEAKKPRYIQLSEQLRKKIKTGEWEVGDRLPSFADMYREYGATTTTMQRVYEILEKEGFVERRSSSGVYITKPASTQTGMLAFVVPDEGGTNHYAASAYAMKLLHSTHQQAAVQGYQLTLSTPQQLRTSHYPIDGCIIQGDLRLVQECMPFDIPMVSLMVEQEGIPSAGIDELAGFKSITEHLLQLGHRRIAALVGTSDTYGKYDLINPLRVQGYHAALAEYGINAPKSWVRRIHKIDSEFTQSNFRHWSYQEMRRWLSEDWDELGCTAIVTQNDTTAIGVIEALRRHGYRVPQDISVTGYDDSGEDAHFNLKLTTVHVPLEEIARRAVHLMDQILTNSLQQTQKVNLPTHLVVGESAIQGG